MGLGRPARGAAYFGSSRTTQPRAVKRAVSSSHRSEAGPEWNGRFVAVAVGRAGERSHYDNLDSQTPEKCLKVIEWVFTIYLYDNFEFSTGVNVSI